jgi:cyanophycin synthetase
MPEILKTRALRGPNLWMDAPALEVTLRGSAAEAAQLAESLLEAQRQVGCHVEGSVCQARADSQVMVVAIENEEVARLCLAGNLEAARELADDVLLGPNTRALYDAARRRGIPVRRLGRDSLLVLGHGARQRRLCGARTDRTSMIAEEIGWEKPLAKEVLLAAGVPTPEGRVVTTVEEAWQAASELGCAVVVKPESANHGKAVFIGLNERAEIEAAFAEARSAGSTEAVIIERCISGAEHRVLVVNGQVVAAARGDALYAEGDGERTVSALIEAINRDPRRADDPAAPLYAVETDEATLAVLARQGYGLDSVPAAGARVLIQRNGNLGIDVTDEVHPANRALCELAARAVGLDIAGVDLVVDDISRPITEQGGAVLEVNPMPGLMMHLRPEHGRPRAVDEAIVASVIPPGEDGRIPIVVVGGGPAGLAEGMQARLPGAGLARGGARAAELLLLHPAIEAAVIELKDESVEQEGLAFDQCQMLILGGGELTPARRLLLRTVASGGAALVPEEMVEQATALCAGRVFSLPADPAELAARLANRATPPSSARRPY